MLGPEGVRATVAGFATCWVGREALLADRLVKVHPYPDRNSRRMGGVKTKSRNWPPNFEV